MVLQFSAPILVENLKELGTDFKPADQLFFDQIAEAAVDNATLKTAAKSSSTLSR